MWTIFAAVYLSVAGAALIPYFLIASFGGMLSGASNAKIVTLTVISALLWPVGVGAGLYSKLKR